LDAAPIGIATADADRNTLFMVAVAHMPALVPLLVQRGADPNFAPPGGDPPIFTALRGAEPTFALLLQQGADPNARDRHGSPILGTALLVERDDAAAALIARGADIHARDADNWSMLMYAVAYRRWAMAEELIQRGIDLTEPRSDGDGLVQMFERTAAEAPAEEKPAIDRVVAAAAARGVSLR
jgi:ankyrin repeat protein